MSRNRTPSPLRTCALAIPLLVASLLAGCGAGDPPRPNILLITLDTVRADRLGCYGHRRETTPHLDRFAESSTRYTRAYAVSSWTLPTHASLFTGKLPTSHGAMYDVEGPLQFTQGIEGPYDVIRARGLGEGEITLAMLLAEQGYITGGIVAGPWMMEVFGLSLGFDSWDDSGITDLNGRRAEEVTRSAVRWLDEEWLAEDRLDEESDDPFFLFLNYYDPHFPYDPPAEYRTAFTAAGIEPSLLRPMERDNLLYDSELLYLDAQIGVLLATLEERGLRENTWILIASDHGELLGPKEWGHGRFLTEEEIHIPLLIQAPGQEEGRVIDALIQQTDILPMILEHLQLPLPSGLQGSASVPVTHPIVAEVYPLPGASDAGDWRAILRGDRKFLWNSLGHHRLIDLAGEREDVAVSHAEECERLDDFLTRYLASLPTPGAAGPAREIDPELMKLMSDLGYLGGDAEPLTAAERAALPR
jgi:arylsulfatase A-like enzyme